MNSVKRQYFGVKKIVRFAKLHYSTSSYSRLMKPGTSMPWLTYPAIEYLSNFELSGENIFEWGSGSSTLWWLSNGAKVTSVEHEANWFKHVNENTIANGFSLDYVLAEDPRDYSSEIHAHDADVILCDGEFRDQCVEQILIYAKVSETKLIILDNSERTPELLQLLRKHREIRDWIEVPFHGFGSHNYYEWTSTILVNPKRRLTLKDSVRPKWFSYP